MSANIFTAIQPPALSPACERMLEEAGLHAARAGDGYAAIRDHEGRRRFMAPATIDPLTLASIINYAAATYREGIALGREQVKSELLSLIGAQPQQQAA